MTGAYPVILGLADMLVRGFLLAMLCGVVFLWVLHRSASGSTPVHSLQQLPPSPRPVPLRAAAYRLRSARPAGGA